MKNLRKQLIIWLFEHSQRLYTRMFKNHDAWNISREALLLYPNGSFGKALGKFLDANNFELIPKVERHDSYHVLTGFGTKVEDEIALQCLCFGNGKRSPYLYGAVFLGVLILPDYLDYYIKSYTIGKQSHTFHHYDYKKLLDVDFETFRSSIFNTSQLQFLNNTI